MVGTVVVVGFVVVGVTVVVGTAVVVGPTVVVPEGAEPALGPAMLVVMGACSMKTPDQNQSSGAALVPPLGRRRTPMCQSSEFVEGLAALFATICVRGADPVEYQRPTVLPAKSMSYAKLYQVLGVRVVLHWDTPPMSQRRAGSVVPASPEIKPNLISVKWLSKLRMHLLVRNCRIYRTYDAQSNLVLKSGVWSVGRRRREREVVVEVSCSEVGRGLGNNFCAFHSLTIPESGSILEIDYYKIQNKML